MPFRTKEEKAAYDRAYRAANKTSLATKARTYYAANRDGIIAKVVARADPVAKREYDRRRNSRPEVREARRQQRERWAAQNPDKVAARIRYTNHRRRGAAPDSDALAYMAVLEHDPCSYCGEGMEHVDHITPVCTGGRGEWTNLTAACRSCNYTKNARPLLTALLLVHPRDGHY